MILAKGLTSLFIILVDRFRHSPFWILILQGYLIAHSSGYHDRIDNTARRYRERIDPHNQVTQQQEPRKDMCARTKDKHQTACSSHTRLGKHNSLDLLELKTLSHDACIVLVSQQTLFTLRERVSQARDGFQITTWHCRRFSDQWVHLQSYSLTTSTEKNKRQACAQCERERQETTDKICLHCPAKHAGNSWEKTKPPRCAGLAHKPKDVFVLRTKLCTSKGGYNGEANRRTCLVSTHNTPQNGCEITRGRERSSRFVFVSALRTKHNRTSLHSWMTCPQN